MLINSSANICVDSPDAMSEIAINYVRNGAAPRNHLRSAAVRQKKAGHPKE